MGKNNKKRQRTDLSTRVILTAVVAFIKIMVVIRAGWLGVMAVIRRMYNH